MTNPPRGILALVLLVGVAGCETLTPQPIRTLGVRHAVEKVEISNDPAVIPPSQFARVIPRIASVRAEPARVELQVGEHLTWRDIKLFASDAEGHTLGYLAIYNRAMEPGAAVLEAQGGVRARYPGASELVLSVPLWEASGGKGMAPAASVRIVVRP